jgi:integrase|tara:strand:+ start:192 stop:1508 length:1317 start_codon:yes stop_codon:yes gene_type:complete
MQSANSSFTFRLYLDTRYVNSNVDFIGKFEVKIRITAKHDSKPKLAKTGIYVKEDIFNALYPSYVAKRIRAKKSFQDSIGAIANKEENQILKDQIDRELREWKNAETPEIRTFDQLKANKGFVIGSNLLKDWVINYNKRDISESQKVRIDAAYKKVNQYFNRKKPDAAPQNEISLYEITPKFLNDWESWCTDVKSHTLTTQIGYAQNLRSIINKAISSQECSYNKSNYPFYLQNENPEGYIIKEDNNKPVAKYVDDKERELFMNYTPQTENEQRAFDIWLFSYYSAGMNATDMYNFKWKNVDLDKGIGHYYRKKTKRQRRQILKPLIISEKHLEIIQRHKGKNEFVFNFQEKFETKKKLSDHFGRQFKKLRKKIGLSDNFSFMSARNSSFTNLSKVASSNEIMETLGTHSKEKTLKGYIKRLNQTQKVKDLYEKLNET